MKTIKLIRITVNVLILIMGIHHILFAQNFNKITTGAIVNDGGGSYNCSWGDYNSDGYLDLFVCNALGDWPLYEDDFLYQNNSDGTFTKIISGDIVTSGRMTNASCWGDYDNDGDLDIYVANYYGSFLYNNDGSGNLIKITTGEIGNNTDACTDCSWGDYDNDGYLDLFVAVMYTNNRLYHNNGDGSFARILSGNIVNDKGKSTSCRWGDYDNDGYLDLYVTNSGFEANFLYHNNGNGTFTKITTGDIVTDLGISHDCNWIDIDNDNDLDLFVVNWIYDNCLYINNGDGTFNKIVTNPIIVDYWDRRAGDWGDFDNDGDLDLFISHTNQNNSLYKNDGYGNFERITNSIVSNDGGQSFNASWGDYNNDGYLDLFVANQQDNNFLYSNNGNLNSWTQVKLIGTVSNTSAIGSKVKVKALIDGDIVSQFQEISGDECLNAHFGLGNANLINDIIIEWPSGISQTLHNIPTNSFLTIIENVNCVVVNNPGNSENLTIDQNGDNLAMSNVNDIVMLIVQNVTWDPLSKIFAYDVALQNTSNDFLFPGMKVTLNMLCPETVLLNNPDGGGPGIDGYWDYSRLLGSDGILSPGEISGVKTWEFYDPDMEGFYFSCDVYAVLPSLLLKAVISVDKQTLTFYADVKNQKIEKAENIKNELKPQLPAEFMLEQNYPNPFNAETMIKYQLPQDAKVQLSIFNLLGQEIRTLVSEQKNAGYHNAIWDGKDNSGKDVVSGVYIYRIKAGEFAAEKKLVVIR